jgi:hypothetical protein
MYLIGRSEDVLVPTAAGLGAKSTRREETKDQMATVYEGLGRGNVTRAGRQQSEPVFFAMPTRIRARTYTRAERIDGKFPKMANSVSKLLETKFSSFAKFSRIATSFIKLLEML